MSSRMRVWSEYGVAAVASVLLGVAALPAGAAQERPSEIAAAIAAMRAASGPDLRVVLSPRTGYATFISAPRGTSMPVPDGTAPDPATRALSFVDAYGPAFGLRARESVSIDRVERDPLGFDHVRMRQVVSGVPVTGGELIVHLRGNRIVAANGKTLDGVEEFSVTPQVGSNEAETVARTWVARNFSASTPTLSEPHLEIFNQGMLNGRVFPTRLAWFVEARDVDLREFIWIDARTRIVLLHFSQIADAKNRAIYNGNSLATLPGTLMRSEGEAATGDLDADKAYDYSGDTWDYFFTNHARDSFDGAGGQLQSTVHHCRTGSPCPYQNAFWNGTQMVYGDGFSRADDVVAHELTHAVTDRTASLFYYMQSGALNESLSDIFGETVDLGNGAGTDTAGVRWQMGEELGAVRNMMDPTLFSDPGKMSDSQFACELDPIGQDQGGVHTNSGVPNHAYALMVDGGTYNDVTIAALDPVPAVSLAKAGKIQYRVLTQYLTSASDFLDNYNALQQACSDLIGTIGITADNCVEVKKALDAVQMSTNWPCATSYGAHASVPPLCSAGTHAVDTFFDGFETGLSNWTISGTADTWYRTSATWGSYATSGVDSLWGYDQPTTSDSRIGLASNISIPTGARLQFNHSYGFENSAASNYDGGVVEYSTDGGTVWSTLSSLYAAGANYGGTISGGPLAGQSGFVKDSFGYVASQYNLASLAGQTAVRFRFRIGTDSSVDDYGWFIDDFRVYQCASDAVATGSATAIGATGATLNGTVNPGGSAASALFQYGLTSSYGSATASQDLGSGSSPVALSADITGLACGTTYHFRTSATLGGLEIFGSDATFTTLSCPAPAVTTEPATGIGPTGATLNGTVNPNTAATSGYFEYGLTPSYGSTTPPQALGSGGAAVGLTADVTQLGCDATYHFRAVATSSGGTSYGLDATFTTALPCPPPSVTTGAATAVTKATAILNGTVNPIGSSTAAFFEYGPTTSYGSTTGSQGLGAGHSDLPLAASITGLVCETLYHFRAVATSAGGDAEGLDGTFTTRSCLTPSGWYAQTAPSAATLFDVQALDENTAVAVGAGGVIFKTVDGGASWDVQTSGTAQSLNGLHFTDANNGWAVGGAILNTTNGGANWNNRVGNASFTSLKDVKFLTSSIGMVAGQAGATGLLRTTDGGQTWSEVFTMNGTTHLEGLFFLDAQKGWAVGFNAAGISTHCDEWGCSTTYTSPKAVILNTTDGGLTWSSKTYASGVKSLRSVFFIDASTGWVVGQDGMLGKTTNGGTTWVAQSSGTAALLSSVVFANAATGWTAGYEGLIRQTTDSGATWGVQSSLSAGSALHSVSFAGAMTGWSVGVRGILKTVDGGGPARTLSATALASSLNPSTAGVPVTFTATVSGAGGTPTGSVTFKDGAATLGSGTLGAGVATFSTSALSLGAHSITAEYAGDATFAASTSTALNQVVNAPAISMSIADASGVEGYLSGSTMNFVVSLSAPAPGAVSVQWATQSLPPTTSATPGTDYTAANGTLDFAAGESRKTIAIAILGDAVSESNETFIVALSGAVGASISDATAIGTIVNDDGSTISVTDYTVAEGTGAGTTQLVFTVITSMTTGSAITVSYATADGTATAGSDYTPTSGTLTFLPWQPSKQVVVAVARDSTIEPNETVRVNLTGATYATIADAQGVGTIQADDGLLVSISDKTSAEGNVGTTPVVLTASLNQSVAGSVSVDWTTADGTATAPLDYQSATGTITFNPGETAKTITLQIVGETGEESYENFFVNLSNPTGGAAVGDGRGQVTITNTDGSTDRSRLMFHNFVTNRLYRWHMKNGNTLDTFNWVTPWATDPGWTVGAVADYDQDGQLDYLWHNVNDGRMLFWYVDGDNLKGFQFLPYLMGPPWKVATTFDANGDGAVDIVYYNGATGLVRVVLHDNATVLGQYDLNQILPPTGTVRVVNAVDADNDGQDELVRYNSATGQVSAWDVNGSTVGGTITYPNTQSTTQAFTLVSTKTDFNDDGLPDFLWHNPTPTGVFSVWFMNGTTRTGVGQFLPFTATDPVWKVVGSANVWP